MMSDKTRHWLRCAEKERKKLRTIIGKMKALKVPFSIPRLNMEGVVSPSGTVTLNTGEIVKDSRVESIILNELRTEFLRVTNQHRELFALSSDHALKVANQATLEALQEDIEAGRVDEVQATAIRGQLALIMR